MNYYYLIIKMRLYILCCWRSQAKKNNIRYSFNLFSSDEQHGSKFNYKCCWTCVFLLTTQANQNKFLNIYVNSDSQRTFLCSLIHVLWSDCFAKAWESYRCTLDFLDLFDCGACHPFFFFLEILVVDVCQFVSRSKIIVSF